jgi:hypothetical protein
LVDIHHILASISGHYLSVVVGCKRGLEISFQQHGNIQLLQVVVFLGVASHFDQADLDLAVRVVSNGHIDEVWSNVIVAGCKYLFGKECWKKINEIEFMNGEEIARDCLNVFSSGVTSW